MNVSVIITSYNQREYLVEAVDSVLGQTVRPYEIIIVDDCSTDGSQEVIATYARRYPDLVRAFCHAKNLGISRNRNFALTRVRGDGVTYLDGDDRFLPRKLEVELDTLRGSRNARIAYSNFYYIDGKGRRTGIWVEPGETAPSGGVLREVFGREFPKGMIFRNELVGYDCLKVTGFYDPSLRLYEDWELRVRLTSRFNVAYSHDPLVEYRIHPSGISKSRTAEHFEAIRRVYRKNRHLLRSLPLPDRRVVEERLGLLLPALARRAADEEIESGHRRAALQYAVESLRLDRKAFDPRLVARIVLPAWAHKKVKTLYRGIKGIGTKTRLMVLTR